MRSARLRDDGCAELADRKESAGIHGGPQLNHRAVCCVEPHSAVLLEGLPRYPLGHSLSEEGLLAEPAAGSGNTGLPGA